MTAFWMRAAFAASGVLTLQACAMAAPQYAPSEGYESPPRAQPAQPQYPTRADQPAPTDPHDPVAHPSTGVSAEPLPPPAAAPTTGPVSLNGARFVDAAFVSAPAAFVQTTPAAWRRHVPAVEPSGRFAASRDEDNGPTVKVKKGDTIKSLAARYGTTPAALMKANHIRRPTDLAVGQALILPAPAVPVLRAGRSARGEAVAGQSAPGVAPSGAGLQGKSTPKTYRTVRGDTIYAIGRKFKVSPGEIEALNGFSPSTHLRTGQVVKLPGAPEQDTAAENTAPGRRVADNTYARPTPTHTPATPIHTPPTPTHAPPPTTYARPEPTYERPRTTIQSPLTTPVVIPPAAPPASVPDHTVPYASLPGHLAAPPERPLAPPVAQPETPGPPLDAQVVLAGRGRFIWPVHGDVISTFGLKSGGQRSDGLDIGAAEGAPVDASATGDVVYAGALPGLGNLVLIKHEDGWITAYAHLARTEVKIKDHVVQGAEVGLVGQSGSAAQPEVYFEIRYAPTPRDKARPVDPQLLLSSQ